MSRLICAVFLLLTLVTTCAKGQDPNIPPEVVRDLALKEGLKNSARDLERMNKRMQEQEAERRKRWEVDWPEVNWSKVLLWVALALLVLLLVLALLVLMEERGGSPGR
jgi:hypothetical protein